MLTEDVRQKVDADVPVVLSAAINLTKHYGWCRLKVAMNAKNWTVAPYQEDVKSLCLVGFTYRALDEFLKEYDRPYENENYWLRVRTFRAVRMAIDRREKRGEESTEMSHDYRYSVHRAVCAEWNDDICHDFRDLKSLLEEAYKISNKDQIFQKAA